MTGLILVFEQFYLEVLSTVKDHGIVIVSTCKRN